MSARELTLLLVRWSFFVCPSFPSVGSVFRSQVQALMTALKACQPHYIRCIKPNHTKVRPHTRKLWETRMS